MWKFRLKASVPVLVLVLALAAAGGVVAATQPSDEQTLQACTAARRWRH